LLGQSVQLKVYSGIIFQSLSIEARLKPSEPSTNNATPKVQAFSKKTLLNLNLVHVTTHHLRHGRYAANCCRTKIMCWGRKMTWQPGQFHFTGFTLSLPHPIPRRPVQYDDRYRLRTII